MHWKVAAFKFLAKSFCIGIERWRSECGAYGGKSRPLFPVNMNITSPSRWIFFSASSSWWTTASGWDFWPSHTRFYTRATWSPSPRCWWSYLWAGSTPRGCWRSWQGHRFGGGVLWRFQKHIGIGVFFWRWECMPARNSRPSIAETRPACAASSFALQLTVSLASTSCNPAPVCIWTANYSMQGFRPSLIINGLSIENDLLETDRPKANWRLHASSSHISNCWSNWR